MKSRHREDKEKKGTGLINCNYSCNILNKFNGHHSFEDFGWKGGKNHYPGGPKLIKCDFAILRKDNFSWEYHHFQTCPKCSAKTNPRCKISKWLGNLYWCYEQMGFQKVCFGGKSHFPTALCVALPPLNLSLENYMTLGFKPDKIQPKH